MKSNKTDTYLKKVVIKPVEDFFVNVTEVLIKLYEK